jgi:hypothetical protein
MSKVKESSGMWAYYNPDLTSHVSINGRPAKWDNVHQGWVTIGTDPDDTQLEFDLGADNKLLPKGKLQRTFMGDEIRCTCGTNHVMPNTPGHLHSAWCDLFEKKQFNDDNY